MAISLPAEAPWLLLTFMLPNKRASQRVEVWRKLKRYGAIRLGNSGYLLPNDPSNQERFQWLATAIRNYGGEASLIEVRALDNLTHLQLVERFSQARAGGYQELIRELERIIGMPPGRRSAARLARLRRRFQEISGIDFFASPLQRRVKELLGRAERGPSVAEAELADQRIRRRDYVARVWVTRKRPGIDRCASAWLIRRFIDARARFTFAAEGKAPERAVPFDMFQGGFGHRGNDCTFETLTKAFRVTDGRVSAIGQIIHDADLMDEKFGRREGYGIDEILKGWARQGLADSKLLEQGMNMVEGLYHSLEN
jgi:hypothetical protein